LTTPGDITVAGDITGSTSASTLNVKAQPDSNTYIQLNNIVDSAIRTVANLEISTANTDHTWIFRDNGNIIFPDSTVQSTAWTGSVTTDRLVNGEGQVVLGSTGILTVPDTVATPYGTLGFNEDLFTWGLEATGGFYTVNLTAGDPDDTQYTATLMTDGVFYLPETAAANVSKLSSEINNADVDLVLVGGKDVRIESDGTDTNKTWTFDNTGNLTTPSTGHIIVTGGIVGTDASPAPYISGFSSAQFIGNVTAANIHTNLVFANAIGGGNTISLYTETIGMGAYATWDVDSFNDATLIIGGLNDPFSTSGNILAGNISLSGTIQTTGVNSTGNITATGTITGNILAGDLSVTGNVVQQSAYYETYANVTNSGGNLTCNFVNGATFYATLTANVTVNFTNVVATAGQVTGATLIVDQGATAYHVANLQINSGGVQTIKYAGGTPNTGTASNTDIMSFSLISLDGTAWRVLGQIANYG
jgi:cytoskeletal protein CcmA (bactofilin family)